MAAKANVNLKVGDSFVVNEYLVSKNRCRVLDLDILTIKDIQNGEVITTVQQEDENGIWEAIWDIVEFQTLVRLGFVERIQERQV